MVLTGKHRDKTGRAGSNVAKIEKTNTKGLFPMV